MSGRSDSWYATVDEADLWKLYAMAKSGSQWFDVTRAAKEELGLDINPSRSGYYRWLDFMRSQESERRLAQARIAALEANDLAKCVGLKDEKAIAAYKSLAAEIALKGDAKTASQFLRMAMDLRDRQIKTDELALKTKDLARKDEELKIAQEKLSLLQAKEAATKNVISDDNLTAEEKMAELDRMFGK